MYVMPSSVSDFIIYITDVRTVSGRAGGALTSGPNIYIDGPLLVHPVDCRASWLLKPPHSIGGLSAEDGNREFNHCVADETLLNCYSKNPLSSNTMFTLPPHPDIHSVLVHSNTSPVTEY